MHVPRLEKKPHRYIITLQQSQLLSTYLYGEFSEEVLALFPAQTEDDVKPAMDRLVTQMGFGASARFTAECMDKVGSPAYLYLFTMTIPDARAEGLGSFHGLEIVYVFGNLDEEAYEGIDEADYELSEAMMTYWTDFAKEGDPNGGGVPDWPAYTAGDAPYQELGESITTGSGLFQQAYELVLQINGL